MEEIYGEEVEGEDRDKEQEQMLLLHEPVIPNYEAEFVHAKTYLQRTSPDSGDNLYDHLTDCLNKILAERPDNIIDFFEEYSRKVKERRHKPATDHLEDIYIPPGRFLQAKKFITLLKPKGKDAMVDPEDDDLVNMANNDMLQLLYYFEMAGIGLPKSEMLCLLLSMKQLIKNEPLASIRFWGKVKGLYKNYYVMETELKEEEYMRRNEEKIIEEEGLQEVGPPPQTLEDVQQEALKAMNQGEEEGEGGIPKESKVPRPLPPIPQPVVEETPLPPTEPAGVGINKKVYYVTNEPGERWTQLPDVTPKQIRDSRLIKKSFSGDLEQEIHTWPDFEGTEKEYLRAQIARISAGTQISPMGFYTFGGGMGEEEEEEEAEEEEGRGGESKTSYRENPRYDPLPLSDLTDKSMSFWVHHTQYILPQGRTSWWNPYPPEDIDEEFGEEEEREKEGPRVEPETGPPLLTPLSEDASLEAVPPWSVRISSNLNPDYAIAIVRSNLWPGAYCFATQGKLFQNIYFGFGHKYISNNFSPTPLPPIEQDYPIGPEVMEMTDPTGAQEEEWRIAHLPKPKPEKIAMEEEEEEEEEEDEDED